MAADLPELDVVSSIVPLFPGSDTVEVVGPWGSAKALTAVQTAQAMGVSLLYVTSGRIEAESAHEDLCTFTDLDACALFPAWEVLPTDKMKPADDIVAERMDALRRMSVARQRGEAVYVTISVRSLLQRVVNRQLLLEDTVSLKVGEEYDLGAIVRRLSGFGYERELMVEQRGEMSVRGGIFDVFPISGELPYRIEFFGDEVESIRYFEPETQRSVETVDEVHILPRSEKALLAEQAASPDLLSLVTDYFDKHTLIVIDEPLAVEEEAEKLEMQLGPSVYMARWEEVLARLADFSKLRIAQVGYAATEGVPRFTVTMRSMSSWAGQTDGFWDQLKEWELAEFTVRIFCNNTGERRRLIEMLEERGYRPGQGVFDLRLGLGGLRAGFADVTGRLAVLSEREMFGRKYVRRRRRRFEAGAAITAFSDLRGGDYIVHIDHGIGRYLGLRRFEGKRGDFMGIRYAGGDIMYVPVTHIDHIQKYVGGDGAAPKVDKLGGATWARTRGKVKKAVREMTEELIKLYAARESVEGHAFQADTHWQREFEDAFEYEETPDQKRAIAEVKAGMESTKPMDRLLCGDVGFGKTEVAIRAAFKAVMEGKQVAVLVPTTVLAEQHYKTFRDRLADYPVRVEMLSRFRSGKEQGQIVRDLKSGEIDIVIGTHRLTSGDVSFADLGLVVLDEEQRFGVRHKERLKQMKTNVDVLTMSATPIPRTLHMSMLGVRDMSIINTAPNDRLPIHTCIEAFDEQLIAEAIQREIAREGQVFYLHNRVQTIERVAGNVRKLVPQARVGIAHGQMHEHELENAMAAFIRREIDVLVCTTIIGSGLDIPNANTIIVDRADRFGLSELYQLRGRVGRWKHRAFAYLLVPGNKALTEVAQKRLKALEEFSTLGSGFRIAMRDLEIRGCGNILGARQSGHIAAVGYDAYNQLIAEAVSELKGEPITVQTLPPFDVNIDAAIPDEYVPLESQKVTLYKRISSTQSVDDVDDMIEELTDRFGVPPEPVMRLLEVMSTRALAAQVGAKRLAATQESLTIEFDSNKILESAKKGLAETFGDRLKFTWAEHPGIVYRFPSETGPVAAAKQLLDTLAEL